MLKTVTVNLAEGAALVAIVLFLTLGSIRGALIAALAIPLSMGIALLGMVRHRRHRQPDVAGGDRLRLARRRRHRDAGGGAGRDIRAQGQDARRRRVPGRAVDEQGGAAGRVFAAHHPAGVPAADGARGGRGADVQAHGDHRRAGAGRRAAVLADGVPGAGGVRAGGRQARSRRRRRLLRQGAQGVRRPAGRRARSAEARSCCWRRRCS